MIGETPPDGGGSSGVTDHVTHHWSGAGGLALVLLGIGVALREPALLIAATPLLAVAGYAGATTGAATHDASGEPVIAVDHEFDDESPDPGDEVTVTVTVRNEDTTPLTDVRVVDGVPPALAVTEGTPRYGDVLLAGSEATFSYVVRVTRGEFDWAPAHVAVADPGDAVERAFHVDADATLECALPRVERAPPELPLRGLTTQYPGRLATRTGGAGLEFYATREYQPGDALSRIDWHRRARVGEFATVEFREEQLARVMLVLDTRRVAYLAPEPGAQHAVDRSVSAAHQLFVSLLESGDQVGLTAFGPTEGNCWLSPYSGDEHRARGRELLSTHPAFSPEPPEQERFAGLRDDRQDTLERRRIGRLRERLLPDTQVILLSPCCDDHVPTIARRLDATGHPVTVLAVDPTAERRPENAVATIERADRLRELRRRGVRVVDWSPDEPLAAALARAATRWSA